MLIIAMLLVGIVAAIAWVVALFTFVQLIGLAPAGEKIATVNRLGWLQTDRIKASIGPAAELPLQRYSRSVITFLACVVLLAVGITLVAMTNNAGPTVTGSLRLPSYSPTLES